MRSIQNIPAGHQAFAKVPRQDMASGDETHGLFKAPWASTITGFSVVLEDNVTGNTAARTAMTLESYASASASAVVRGRFNFASGDDISALAKTSLLSGAAFELPADGILALQYSRTEPGLQIPPLLATIDFAPRDAQ